MARDPHWLKLPKARLKAGTDKGAEARCDKLKAYLHDIIRLGNA
ncbi:hypothetical protein M2336_003179 [Sphingobium sp. B1D7B]|nr:MULTISPECIES: hypothetical protein [unclassified Sphingobium]MCW2382320.1 hypothetical protein [Sphingobium sp. B2D3B]MCW2391339.1 hypothetical protein [Sphingobium sp. B11D3A]MCW2397507.1 hypothetical protein [Sphingobium sp. B2D3C]MCW2406550.1 hypothetical protein [Sphingobium sp. B1D7B]MCW2412762.1 hypothetical protein [Sphingobium sp. B8D3D]